MKLEYLSASRVKTLNDCRKLFYHKYILKDIEDEDGPYAVLGSALHKALEEWRKDTSIDKRKLVAIFLEAFTLGNKHYLFKEGCTILYELNFKNLQRGELVSTEYEFELELDGIPVKGVVDKIEKTGENKLLVTDYKSNKQVKPEEYVHQLAIYDYALEQKFPGTDRQHELYYLRHNKSVPFKFTPESWTKVGDIFRNVNRLVLEGHDKPENWSKLNKKGGTCSYCPLTKSCWGE